MRLRQSATPPAKREAARAFCALPRGVRTGEPPPLLTRPTPRSLRAAFAPACLLTRFHPLALPADESEFALRATPPWRRREQLQQAGLLHGRARQELRRRGRRGLPPSPPRFPCAAAVSQLPPSPRATALRERRGAAVAPAGASDAGVVVGCGCRVGDVICVLDAVWRWLCCSWPHASVGATRALASNSLAQAAPQARLRLAQARRGG